MARRGGGRDAEAVEGAVEGRDIGAAVRNSESAEVIPRFDLCAARPQFLAGLSVERVKRGAPRTRNAPHRSGTEPAAVARPAWLVPCRVLHHLRRIFAGGIREHDAV